MKISDIINKIIKPTLYEKGTAFMWTDEYISKQLLDIHLNPDIDLASRKPKTIKKTADWILSKHQGKQLNILDLGCGPGLYTEYYSKKGHKVTGVDISENSIEYAQNQARLKSLDISYINANYLQLELKDNSFDLITMIFTDFGVLHPEERNTLLNSIYKMLKKGGVFIFDVLNDNNIESKITPKEWNITKKGFWRPIPYLELKESFLYPDEKVILYQTTVIEDDNKTDIYRFWMQHFSNKNVETLLQQHNFKDLHFDNTILPSGDLWSGENVTFCMAKKV